MKTVLLVEDNVVLAQVITEVLHDEGYGVIVATDGAQGLHLLSEITPDLVLSTVDLPQVSGVELAERLGSDPSLPDVPVVLMSASWEPSATGFFVGYLQKPFTLDALLATVGGLIDPGAVRPQE